MASVEKWMGRSFPEGSRLHQALDRLDQVASTGQFAGEAHATDLNMRAIGLALDVFAIQRALPAARVTDFRRDLESFARGSLAPDIRDIQDLQALQAQSQLVVRAALSLAEVNPTQPTHSGAGGRKKPDILVENGLSTYGIEVKRPTASKNVMARAKDGADQLLNADLRGGVVIDVTDCLTQATPTAADDEVLRQAAVVSGEFFTHEVGWHSGCSHVLMVGVFARPMWHYSPTGDNEGQVLVHSTSFVAAFGTAHGTLDTRRSHWLRSSLETGLNRLGFTSDELTPKP